MAGGPARSVARVDHALAAPVRGGGMPSHSPAIPTPARAVARMGLTPKISISARARTGRCPSRRGGTMAVHRVVGVEPVRLHQRDPGGESIHRLGVARSAAPANRHWAARSCRPAWVSPAKLCRRAASQVLLRVAAPRPFDAYAPGVGPFFVSRPRAAQSGVACRRRPVPITLSVWVCTAPEAYPVVARRQIPQAGRSIGSSGEQVGVRRARTTGITGQLLAGQRRRPRGLAWPRGRPPRLRRG